VSKLSVQSDCGVHPKKSGIRQHSINHWIGFVGKILTGNPWVFTIKKKGLSGFNFPIIQFYESRTRRRFTQKNMCWTCVENQKTDFTHGFFAPGKSLVGGIPTPLKNMSQLG